MIHRKNMPQRLVVCIKDIMTITGRGKESARRMYNEMMTRFGKKPEQYVTYREFSQFTGIEESLVLEYLRH